MTTKPPPPPLPLPTHPTPPRAERYVTAPELEAAVADARFRLGESELVTQRRIGELEHGTIQLAGERYAALDRRVSATNTSVNDLRLSMNVRFDIIERMLRQLLAREVPT